MDQPAKDELAKARGLPKDVQEALDAGTDHSYYCRCNICKQWWEMMGPDPGNCKFGPFSYEEMGTTAQKALDFLTGSADSWK